MKKKLFLGFCLTVMLLLVTSLAGCIPGLPGSNPPAIGITVNSPGGSAPFKVQFSGKILVGKNASDWSWDLKDGSPIAFGQFVTHTYYEAGTYEVVLTATVDNRICSNSQTIVVSVPEPIECPIRIVDINYWTSGDCCMYATFEVYFTGGIPVTYEWNFGDGRSSSLASPTHRYLSVGSHYATLKVKGENGIWSATYQVKVDVGNCCQPYYDPCPCPSPCNDCLTISPSYSEFPAYTWKTITVSFDDCNSCGNPCYNICNLSSSSCCGTGYVLIGEIIHCGGLADSANFEAKSSGARNTNIGLKFHKTGEWKVEFVRYNCSGQRICSIWGKYGIYLP